MRTIAALFITLWLGACASGLLTPIQNPVTKEQLYAAEATTLIIVTGLNVYRRSCVAGALPPSCENVVRTLQGYTMKLPTLLTSLRTFVKKNDQVTAVTIYNSVVALIADIRTVAAINGVKLEN